MPVNFPLSSPLAQAGWRVKIQEKEILEPPHVTVIRGTRKWRINLRSRGRIEFLDRVPPPREVPRALLREIRAKWKTLCDAWDRKYPENPVASSD